MALRRQSADDWQELARQACVALESSSSLAELQDRRSAYLGKKSLLAAALKEMGALPLEEKKIWGPVLQGLRLRIEEAAESKKEALQRSAHARLSGDWNYSLPVYPEKGGLHPLTLTMQRIEDIFSQWGFNMVQGPQVETDYYNFTALNIPAHHPARAMHDTFYVGDKVLRTHTSSVQIHAMRTYGAPLRAIAMGPTYRRDSDATHSPMFHQVEGLWIDSVESPLGFGALKGLLLLFLETFFEQKLRMRLRPSFFPFTEPSAEVDMLCVMCQGQGCSTCKQSGWLEVLGCGLVHTHVLEHGEIDPKRFQGLAFGAGIERLAMIKYGIPDLRLFYDNDRRFLQHFS